LKNRIIEIDKPFDVLYKNDAQTRLKLFGDGTKITYYELFGDDKGLIEALAEQQFLSKERKIFACEQLKQIFLENNIASDFYKKHTDIPRYCEPRQLIAMLMADEIDEEMFNFAISEIIQINNDTALKKNPFGESDIYEYFDRLKNADDSQWEIIETIYENCLRIRRIYGDEIKFGEPIHIECFEQAIVENLIHQGISEKAAKEMMKQIISYSNESSERIFTEAAQNCFRQEMLKSRQKTQKGS